MKKSSPSDIGKMDSLKVPPKGSSNNKSSSGSIPITVRFNAGEESIDDLFQSFNTGGGGGGGGGGGVDSLSSSPHQNVEENPRNTNFLQGNFFNNRRRSGSIEGSPSGSAGDSNSMGTWKLFKGRVSQAMGDIKSSSSTTKPINQPTPTKSETYAADIDSDAENATINSSISDELSLDQEIKMITKQNDDSDSDVEPDIFSNDDIETSTIRKSFANLRSKVSNKTTTANSGIPQQIQPQQQQPQQQQQHEIIENNDTNENNTNLSNDNNNRQQISSPSTSSSSSVINRQTNLKDLSPVARASLSIRNSLLRNRKINQNTPTNTTTTTNTTTNTTTTTTIANELTKRSQKKYIEIESGIEMMEDTDVNTNNSSNKKSNNSKNAETNESKRNKKKFDKFKSSCCCPQSKSSIDDEHNYNNLINNDTINNQNDERLSEETNISQYDYGIITRFIIKLIISEFPYITLLICVILLTVFDLPDFFRGVIACVMTFSIINKAGVVVEQLLRYLGGPERVRFSIPDYSKMPILEIPQIQEFQISKQYQGWMNTINHYDPDTFKISLTHSMYIRLEGSTISLYETYDRIPKRQMWNEKEIDRKTLQFLETRTFNMLGCKVELKPRGLARKRYFNRKYPIQLIFKNKFKEQLGTTVVEEIPKNMRTLLPKTKVAKTIDKHNIDEKTHNKDGIELNKIDSQQQLKENTKLLSEQSSSLIVDEKIGFNKNSMGNDLNGSPSIFSEMLSINNSICADIELENDNDLLRAELALAKDECPNIDIHESDIPFSDETQIWLFARCDRQKEDWYRVFCNASKGFIQDHNVHLSNVIAISDELIEATTRYQSPTVKYEARTGESEQLDEDLVNIELDKKDNNEIIEKTEVLNDVESFDNEIPPGDKSTESSENIPGSSFFQDEVTNELAFEGLIIANSAGRNSEDYIRFMSTFQKACTQSIIPIINNKQNEESLKKQQRNRRADADLWKGVHQSLFLGPSGSVVWFNVLIGRFVYSCLHNEKILNGIQILLQKKISAIKLPNFLEDIVITNINMGKNPPLLHRVSQPLLDERGLWVDADLTYEGLAHLTITAKLNLMRLKKGAEPAASTANTPPNDEKLQDAPGPKSNEIVFDSDAESDGGSSDEDDTEQNDELKENNVASKKGEGKAKRIFKFVDRIATSNLFQLAAEIPVVQKAMEKASTNITLRVDLKGLVGRVVVNIPPPPSDRIWIAFRAPPRLWLSAKPAFGDMKVDWSIVTTIIENRICYELTKFLVYPNMADVAIPLLGSPTYSEE